MPSWGCVTLDCHVGLASSPSPAASDKASGHTGTPMAGDGGCPLANSQHETEVPGSHKELNPAGNQVSPEAGPSADKPQVRPPSPSQHWTTASGG